MASLKLHVYRGEDNGTGSCDFRGDAEIGHDQGDEHRTVLEIDPVGDELIAETLQFGTTVNMFLNKFKANQPEQLEAVADALGLEGEGPVGLRFGLWDQ